MTKAKSVIALGMFDGVHLGHRALLARTVELANEFNATSTVFTFSNHPMELFCGNVSYLSNAEQRRRLFIEAGIEQVDMLVFDRDIAHLNAQEFLNLLHRRYNISHLVVGYNYSFASGGNGNATLLRELGQQQGFFVEELMPVLHMGEAVSSSRIRKCLAEGRLTETNAMLKRPYCIEGEVIENRHIGKTIGFPTANIDYKRMALPKDGVYATVAVLNGKRLAAITNVGKNPTVGGTRRTVETHIIDASGDFYHNMLAVQFVERIRNEITFESVEQLKQRIQTDVHIAKQILQAEP